MNYYLLFKSLHLVAVISWMAGLLYLPRIFVYHVENMDNEKTSRIFKTMEKRLMLYIMNPAMITSILLILAHGTEIYSSLWVQLKLSLVIILTIYHYILGGYLKKFEKNENIKTAKFFRIINEIPTVLLILIIFIIIYKPL